LVVRTVKSYRDLLVWQKSMVLAESCYQITNGFTRDDQQVLGPCVWSSLSEPFA